MVENSLKLTGLSREAEANLCRRSLAQFVRHAWSVIEPTTTILWDWPLDAICDHIQALLEGRLDKRNLIINVPPGSCKSTILSVCAPAWMWLRKPSWRALFISGDDGVALRDSMKCRDIIESQWYQQTFRPDWSLSKDQNAKGHYRNTKTGFRQAISVGARITGKRADAIFVDDPNDAEGGKADRMAVNSWWDNAAYNRLTDMSKGVRCLIQQRLHEEDLTGHILKKDREDWDVLVIRQEYEIPQEKDPDTKPTSLKPVDPKRLTEREAKTGYTLQGWKDPRREPGELFFPARFPMDVVLAEKRLKGSAGYAGQHQQRPAAAEGNIFRRAWFKTYRLHPDIQRQHVDRIVQSWDTAQKTGQENDYTVCTTWGITKNAYYLLHVWKEKVESPELRNQIKFLASKWSPSVVLVEDTSAGTEALQTLRRDTRIPFVPVKPLTDKVARANSVSPLVEAGLVMLPEGEPWVADYLDSICLFPAAAHDDDVDSTTQFLTWANINSGSSGLRLGRELESASLDF
jgi:predicted phage terminase large subunit-like protein